MGSMAFVYLIENFENGTYKIGYTAKNPSKRLKQLTTGNHSDLMVKTFFKSQFAKKIEIRLHIKYQDKRLNGEWFLLEQDEVNNFNETCKSIESYFEVLKNYNNPFL